jgi:hypothetical protein
MKTEFTISEYDAAQAVALISQYLKQGGVEFDRVSLDRVMEALAWADSIAIPSQDGGAND